TPIRIPPPNRPLSPRRSSTSELEPPGVQRIMPPGRASNLHAERDPAPPTHSSLCPRKHAHHSCAGAKRRTVIHPQARLSLPLMDHLVQHCVLDFRPWMACEMPPADGDLDGPTGSEIDAELAEPGSHPPRYPEREGTQRSTEVLLVESLMELLQPMQKE